MAQTNSSVKVDEFGDFQTPVSLATQICWLLADRGGVPASVVEPTCGVGNFLLAAFERFPGLRSAIGVEINSDYVDILNGELSRCDYAAKVKVIQESFFNVDWTAVFRDLPEPILVIGNPPWVTNSALGVLGSTNLPKKSNFQNHGGLEALTGKSNFDISEWMLMKLLEMLSGRKATLAMLCKTAVARKALVHAWKNDISLSDAEIHPIDAAAHFDAAVDACLLTCALSPSSHQRDCKVYRRFGDSDPATVIGYHDGELVANVLAFDRWKHLKGEEIYKWRSGVKHDCSKVMELRKEGHRFRNGLDEVVDLESEYVYPLLKSSEITNGRSKQPSRWMLVTQRAVSEETSIIRETAPKTWAYLQRHGDLLDRRASSIYRGRPRFSVFGVGDYTFAPWKVAISGFYKDLHFTVVGGFLGKPIVLDDTCYFVPCQSKAEADYVASLLNSTPSREFFSAYIFWDAKRPITIETLRRLDLSALAHELGSEEKLADLTRKNQPMQKYFQHEMFG
jgi:hypothetical protein